jgi:hypothetical protein
MINPGRRSYGCSLDTLRFADRVKELKVKVESLIEMQWQQAYQQIQQQAELHRREPYTTEEEPQEHHQSTIEGQKGDGEECQQSMAELEGEFAIPQTDLGDSSDSHQLREHGPLRDNHITVFIRKRPFNETQLARTEVGVIPVLFVNDKQGELNFIKCLDNQRFTFDYAFGDPCCNNLVYKYTAKLPVQNIFKSWMTIYFLFGQTGNGNSTQDSEKCLCAMGEDVFNTAEAPTKLVHLTEHGTNDSTSWAIRADPQSSGSRTVFQTVVPKSGTEFFHVKLLIDRAANDVEVTSCLKSHEGIEAPGNNKPPLPLEGRIPEFFQIGTHAPSGDTSVPYIYRGSLVRGTTIRTLTPGDGLCGRRVNSLLHVDLMEQLKKHMEEVTENQMQLLNRLFAMTSAPTNSLTRISPGRSIAFQRRQAQIKNPSLNRIRRRRMKSKLMCPYA